VAIRVALIDQSSTQVPGLDLHHQNYAISFPPFVHDRHFRHTRQAAGKAGLKTAMTGAVDHSDRTAHMMYNAHFCTYHTHPHNPLCSIGRLVNGVFDALVIDYSASFLTVTWLETYSPFSLRKGGFTDGELGGRLLRDRQYWVAMEERIASLVYSVNKERGQEEDKRSPPAGLCHKQLVFLGELGADDLLRRFLHNALVATPFDFDVVTIHDSFSPVIASACGAADTEKAIMDASEPVNCFEDRECKDSSGESV